MSKRKYNSSGWFNPQSIEGAINLGSRIYKRFRAGRSAPAAEGKRASRPAPRSVAIVQPMSGRRVFPYKSRRKKGTRKGKGKRVVRRGGKRRFGPKFSYSAPYHLTQLGAGRLTLATGGSQLLIANAATDVVWEATGSSTPSMFLPVSQLLLMQQQLNNIIVSQNANSFNALPAAGNYQRPDRYLLEKAELETVYQNCNNFGHNVTLYYCRPRKDILYNASYDSVDEILANSFTAEGNTITGGMLSTTPFMAHQFCQLFKIYHVRTAFVGAGDEMVVRLSRKRPKLIDINSWYLKSAPSGAVTYTQEYVAARGLTKFVMYRVQGTVMGPSSAPDATNVTTGPPTFDFKTQFKFTIRAVLGGQTQNYLMSSISSTAGLLPATALASLKMVTEDTDLPTIAANV